MTQTARFFRSYSLYTVMMRLNGFLTTTLVLLVCTPVAAGNEGNLVYILIELPLSFHTYIPPVKELYRMKHAVI